MHSRVYRLGLADRRNLNGPLAIVLRLFGQVPLAALSFLIGALISRVSWIAVGKVSGSDPESVFAAERY